MKKLGLLLCITLSFCLCKSDDSSTGPDEDIIRVPPGYELVWHDEFDKGLVDPNRWEYEVNADGGGNNELQYYTNRYINAFISEGQLFIRALKEDYSGEKGTRDYTSARIRTKNKGDWKYGRFEIRARMPIGRGLWPAIWMMPTDNAYGSWPASGEMDIMEYLGHEPARVYGTLHYGGAWPQHVYTGTNFVLNEGDFHDGFHVFSMDWDSTSISWFVDDSLYQTQTQWRTSAAPYPAPFDRRFHLILNVAVGGNWPGNPDASTTFPQEMVVDYIRVFQKME